MDATIPFLVRKLNQQVPAAETHIDDALIALSSLMATVVTARRDIGGAQPAREHGTIYRLVKVQMALVDASGGMLRVHGELSSMARETAGLDLHECPSRAALDEPQRRAAG